MDSGSQVTTITESCYNKHFKSQDKLQDCKWIKLTAANGLQIPVIGMMTLPITIQEQTFEDVHILVVCDPHSEAFKAKKLQTPGVLGCNVIGPLYDSIIRKGCIMNSHHPVPLREGLRRYEVQQNWCQTIATELATKEEGILGVIKTKNSPVTVPAQSVLAIECTTRKLPEGYTALAEPLETTLPSGLIVIPTFSRVSNGKILVEVQNDTKQDIILQNKVRIAKLCASEEMQPNYDIKLAHSDDGSTQAIVTTSETYLPREQSWGNLPFKLDIDHSRIPSDENSKLSNLFHAFTDVFSHHDEDLGYTNMVEHRIQTTDDLPIKQPDRRVPPMQVPEVKKILNSWLKQGIIEESTSPYASQMVLVRKKTGEIRICVDYRNLNNKTVKDAYPLPRMEECIESLKGAKYFCSLDLAQGYLQVKLKEEDREKTAFRALGRLFQWTRLCFGLCNSPATFQRLMGRCFGDMYKDGLIVYLDDMMVYGSSIEEVRNRLEIIFLRLRKHGLKLKPSKCHFFKDQVTFLGHTISARGIETDKEKIRAVTQWSKPETEKQLRQFLGLASYFRRFIKGFAQIAGPLHELIGGQKKTQKRKVIQSNWKEKWTDKCDQAFAELKEKLTTAPLLGYPDFTMPFCLEVDASLEGFGAVLMQQQHGKNIVIAYASRKLKAQEKTMKNYSSMKIEFLALHWAITKKFRDYLYGTEFVVKTDNHPLSKMMTAKQTAADMGKLAELADFNFTIEYKSGKTNRAADAFSRNPVEE